MYNTENWLKSNNDWRDIVRSRWFVTLLISALISAIALAACTPGTATPPNSLLLVTDTPRPAGMLALARMPGDLGLLSRRIHCAG